jgi:hypothetical protein
MLSVIMAVPPREVSRRSSPTGAPRSSKAWPELFRRRPVRKAWKDARKGKGHQHWEAVFNRIVWREGFEEHLRELGRAAGEPAASTVP